MSHHKLSFDTKSRDQKRFFRPFFITSIVSDQIWAWIIHEEFAWLKKSVINIRGIFDVFKARNAFERLSQNDTRL